MTNHVRHQAPDLLKRAGITVTYIRRDVVCIKWQIIRNITAVSFVMSRLTSKLMRLT